MSPEGDMIASRPLTSVPCDPPAGPAVGGGVRRGGGSRDGDLPRARRRVSARAGVWNPECGDALEGVSQCAHAWAVRFWGDVFQWY